MSIVKSGIVMSLHQPKTDYAVLTCNNAVLFNETIPFTTYIQRKPNNANTNK